MEFRWNFLTLLHVDFNTWNPRGQILVDSTCLNWRHFKPQLSTSFPPTDPSPVTPIAKDSLVRNLTNLSHVRSISNWHQCEGRCTCTPRQQDLDWREMIKIAAFIWRQSYVSYQWVISDSSVFHKYCMRLFTYSVRDTYANIFFFSDFQWYLGVTSAKHASYVC